MTENITSRQIEAAKILEGALRGDKRDQLALREGISTSDLPLQLAPTINKIMLQNYADITPVWDQFAQRLVVDDFRPIQYMNMAYEDDGLDNAGDKFYEGALPTVGELDEYPTVGWFSFSEADFQVKKSGSRVRFSWEAVVNDNNISVLERLPGELARKARGLEDLEATKQLVSPTGLNTTNFNSGNQNVIAGNPTLTLESLEQAIRQVNLQTYNGRQVTPFTRFVLMVSPGLELEARKILAIQQVRTEITDGDTVTSIVSGNPIGSSINIVVNHWLKKINTGADNYWFLLPVPADTLNPGIVLGFLRGFEAPELRVKSASGTFLGGGAVPENYGSFDNDDWQMRIRHIATGGFLFPQGTVASTGAGS